MDTAVRWWQVTGLLEGLNALALAQTFAAAFFGILFLQSGLDKVFDWKGNREYVQGVFANSRLRPTATVMLGIVLVVEVSAGLCSAAGVLAYWVPTLEPVRTLGHGLACLALCMLFFGQRVVKDYVGAATLATYFGVALLSLYLDALR